MKPPSRVRVVSVLVRQGGYELMIRRHSSFPDSPCAPVRIRAYTCGYIHSLRALFRRGPYQRVADPCLLTIAWLGDKSDDIWRAGVDIYTYNLNDATLDPDLPLHPWCMS